MISAIWKKGNFSVEYKNPYIIEYKGDSVENINQNSFIYEVVIKNKDELLATYKTSFFAKVHNLKSCINNLLSVEEKDMYKTNKGNTIIYRACVELEDSLDFDYSYKIDKVIKYFFDENGERNKLEYYSLTFLEYINNTEVSYGTREEYGKSIYINYLSENDLKELLAVTDSFINLAVDKYFLRKEKVNKKLKNRKIKKKI